MENLLKNDKKTIWAWAMYDWANSVYSLTITTAVFPIYYSSITAPEGSSGMVSFLGATLKSSVLYSYALSFSFLLIMILSPLLTGIADYSGKKKRFMQFFCYMGALACMGLYFFDGPENVEWGIIMAVLASIGYAGSIVFYNAFLPEIASEDKFDSVSARGFSLGYIGSVLLLIVNLAMIQLPDFFGLEGAGIASRISFIMVGIWWAGFAQITFSRLPDNVHKRKPQGNYLTNGFKEIKKVYQQAKGRKLLIRYLMAFFLFSMGVQTVMYLASIFGETQLGMGAGELIPLVLIIQLVAIFGAWFFSRVSSRLGNIRALSIQVVVWLGICLAAFFITNSLQFMVLGFFVGLVMGGIQALARSTYSKLIPDNTLDTASFFSFYDVLEKGSIVLGTFYFGLSEQLFGDMRYSLIGLNLFFIIALVILSKIPSRKVYLDTELMVQS